MHGAWLVISYLRSLELPSEASTPTGRTKQTKYQVKPCLFLAQGRVARQSQMGNVRFRCTLGRRCIPACLPSSPARIVCTVPLDATLGSSNSGGSKSRLFGLAVAPPPLSNHAPLERLQPGACSPPTPAACCSFVINRPTSCFSGPF